MSEKLKLLMDLRGLRKEANVTVVEVSTLSGIAKSNVDRIEVGGTPSLLNALKYASFLHVPVEEIWAVEDDKVDEGKKNK